MFCYEFMATLLPDDLADSFLVGQLGQPDWLYTRTLTYSIDRFRDFGITRLCFVECLSDKQECLGIPVDRPVGKAFRRLCKRGLIEFEVHVPCEAAALVVHPFRHPI